MTKDLQDADFELADPKPAALIESLRAFGYTTQAAVASSLALDAGIVHNHPSGDPTEPRGIGWSLTAQLPRIQSL